MSLTNFKDVWDGYHVTVKKGWKLTEEISRLYFRSVMEMAAELLHDDPKLTHNMLDWLEVYLIADVQNKQRIVESEFWTWASDNPELYEAHPIITQVIDIQKI